MPNQEFVLAGALSTGLSGTQSTITFTTSQILPISYYIKRMLLVVICIDTLGHVAIVKWNLSEADAGSQQREVRIGGDNLQDVFWDLDWTLDDSAKFVYLPVKSEFNVSEFPLHLVEGSILMIEQPMNQFVSDMAKPELSFVVDNPNLTAAASEQLDFMVILECVVA